MSQVQIDDEVAAPTNFERVRDFLIVMGERSVGTIVGYTGLSKEEIFEVLREYNSRAKGPSKRYFVHRRYSNPIQKGLSIDGEVGFALLPMKSIVQDQAPFYSRTLKFTLGEMAYVVGTSPNNPILKGALRSLVMEKKILVDKSFRPHQYSWDRTSDPLAPSLEDRS